MYNSRYIYLWTQNVPLFSHHLFVRSNTLSCEQGKVTWNQIWQIRWMPEKFEMLCDRVHYSGKRAFFPSFGRRLTKLQCAWINWIAMEFWQMSFEGSYCGVISVSSYKLSFRYNMNSKQKNSYLLAFFANFCF